jgi:hypothetical protein
VREGEAARIDDASYCALFGVAAPVRAGVLWEHAIDAGREAVLAIDPDAMGPLALIATHGTLARRLVRAAGDAPPREALRLAYARLRDCLAHDAAFLP